MAYRFTPAKSSKLEELSSIDLSTPLGAKQIIGSVDGTSVGPISVLSALPAPDGDALAATGSVISWTGAAWEITAGGSVSNVADLGDVAVNDTSLVAGQVLKWDDTANGGLGAWVNGADVVGGAGPSVFADLADCSGTPDAAKDGYALIVQTITPGDPTDGYCFKPAPLNFIPNNYPANDITLTHVSNWNMAHLWGNHADQGYATIGALSGKQDLLGGGNNGDVLTWDGTAWGPAPVGAGAGADEAFIMINVDVTYGGGPGPDFVTYNNHSHSTLSVLQGMTYRFDLSNPNCSSLVWAFSKVADGTNADPTEPDFTTGVTSVGTPGTPGAYIEIKISASWPYVDVPKLYIYVVGYPTFYTGLNIIRGWERAGDADDGMALVYNTSFGGAVWRDPSLTEVLRVSTSGGLFQINGPTPFQKTLLPGVTYKFDQSDSSNSTHQIAFSTTFDGTHGGGSQWFDGVTEVGTPGTPGAYTTLEITSTTPQTLYYFCESHPGMGGQLPIQQQLPPAAPSGSVLTWSGSQWQGVPSSGGGGSSIPDGTQDGDIPVWVSGGSGGSWAITQGPDPRYLASDSQCRVISFANAMDNSTIIETVSIFTDVWLMCQNGQGESVSLQIPDILDTDNPKGRRLLISDINGIAESEEIVVSIQSPGAGGTLGAIDSNVPGTTESVFDSASLTLVCTGIRTTPGDATTGLIWKIV